MPIAVAEAPRPSAYGQFPEHIERDWLGRWCHLSEADLSLARRRTGDITRLGFAAQLVTVRAIGTFLADPSAVPAPIVASLARQLDIADPGALVGYGKLPVRWKHTAEIRRRYGYADFASQPGHFSLLRSLYRQAWADDLGPTALFRAGHRKMLADRVVLPGEQVLVRVVGSVRERATQRLWSRLAALRPRRCARPWRPSWWCPRASAIRTLTACAGRRSAPPSPGWFRLSIAWARSAP